MVAEDNRELLMVETVESGLPKRSSARNTGSVLSPTHKLERNPANALEVMVQDDAEEDLEDRHGSQGSEWMASIKDKVEKAGRDDAASSWSKLSIYRIPQYLKDGEVKAYVPQTVSIGPYHHGEERLRHMDQHKWRSLHHVLKRTKQDVRVYLDAVRELEEKARACYEGTIEMPINEFVEMMVLDGCFILEIFRGTVDEGFEELGYPRNVPVFSMRGLMNMIGRDMIMLENQVPLFVLEQLLVLQLGTENVAELAIRFFNSLLPTDGQLELKTTSRTKSESLHTAAFDLSSENSGLHCLDVFRKSLLGTACLPRRNIREKRKRWFYANQVADEGQHELIHCVTELREAGIKFKKRQTARFWDIKFEDDVLWIPRLFIQDSTRALFRNLIAFEQSHFECSDDITSYVMFMDNLINSSEDVRHLHYRGIIEHMLGSDAEVANLFNQLGSDVVWDINDNYLSMLSAEVNICYNHRWNTWKASLKHNYFNNPWSIISFVAAVVLLFLTLAQTFYTVYGYYRPHS